MAKSHMVDFVGMFKRNEYNTDKYDALAFVNEANDADLKLLVIMAKKRHDKLATASKAKPSKKTKAKK